MFSKEEIEKIIKEIIEVLKDLYRIWIRNNREKIPVIPSREKLNVGVIQFKLLEEEFEKLKNIIINLSRNPHIHIRKEFLFSPVYEVEEISPQMLNYLISSKSESSTIYASKKIISNDIYENRFVKGVLIRILEGIKKLLKDLEELKGNEKYKKEINEMITKVEKRIREMNFLLNLEFISDIKPEFEIRITPIIMNNPYYNAIYRFFIKWQSLCFPFEAKDLNLQSLDEWRLYELWVFVKIYKKLREKFGEPKEMDLFKIDGNRIKLKIGEIEENKYESAKIEWENYSLYYQRQFEYNKTGIGSYTIKVRPDVVIEKRENSKIKMIIFDAKKMEAEDLVKDREDIELSTDRLNEYIENLFSDKIDKETAKSKLIQYVKGLIKLDRRTAIAQLHQYKECIVDFDNNGERIVKGAYAIIPRKGNVEDEEYMKFFEDNYRTEWGFGAFVFDVLNDDELNKELEKVLMVVNGV